MTCLGREMEHTYVTMLGTDGQPYSGKRCCLCDHDRTIAEEILATAIEPLWRGKPKTDEATSVTGGVWDMALHILARGSPTDPKPKEKPKMIEAQPLHDRVIVRRTEQPDEVKVGSLIIPEQARTKPTSGVVLAVGSGRILEDGTVRALDVRVGDTVLFGKYSGTDLELEELPELERKGVLILREDEILAITKRAS